MIELLTPDEMAACDRLAIAGDVAGIALMEKAGRAVANAVARHPLGTRVIVVAGPKVVKFTMTMKFRPGEPL